MQTESHGDGGNARELVGLTDQEREHAIAEAVEAMRAMDDVAFRSAAAIIPLLGASSKDSTKAIVGGAEIEPHPDHYQASLVSKVMTRILEDIGNRHGIYDLAQDNGHRVLQVKLQLNLAVVGGRNGNDLKDSRGFEYELKTCNLDNAKPAFTTSHHLIPKTINKYRRAGFIFAAYRGGQIVSIYVVHPQTLSRLFDNWESSLNNGKSHLNNPVISLANVREKGELVWGEPIPRRRKLKDSGQTSMDVCDREDLSRLADLEAALDASLARAAAADELTAMKREKKALKEAARVRKRAERAALQQGELFV
jgi:Restriction endonuclease PvuII.